jgi:hypothetical protein
LSGKTSNETKYKKYLDFIIGWVKSWTEEIKSEEEYVESFKRFEEFIGRKTTMEVLGAERFKVIDDYIAVTLIPNRETLQRHHMMEVRSIEENTIAAADHDHSSNKKCEDSVKPHHGIAKTALTLDKNSRKRNGGNRQEEADASVSHALWAINETVYVVTMFDDGLNMRQYDERRHYKMASQAHQR